MSDEGYIGIPWQHGGASREGADCRGVVQLWLREQMALEVQPLSAFPASDAADQARLDAAVAAALKASSGQAQERGDVVFFRPRNSPHIRHVAVCLGGGRYLETTRHGTRVVNSLELIARTGLVPVGHLKPADAQLLGQALASDKIADPSTVMIALFVLSVALSAASAFLMPRPKIGAFRNQTGQYGFDQLVTRSDPTLPLPDVLGGVVVAGNSPYQSLIDKSQPATDATQQRVNKIVVLASGPITGVSYDSAVIKVNGRDYRDTGFHPDGMALDPAQTKAEAVDGTIGSSAARPSITTYLGTAATSVPVDVRAHYDRNFPLYGFNGCAYLVLRLIDSSKFTQFNLTVPVKGRQCRTFDANGFIQTTVTSEAVGTGDGATTRFKLDFEDIATVTTVTVGGVTYTEASEDQQAGTVYRINKVKGYLEFFTAPAGAAAVVCTYVYYPRSWTQNPVTQSTYLLTEPTRGKGLDASRIAWDRAVSARDHCDEQVLWESASGQVIEARHTGNYSVDYVRPIQDHIRALLDAFYGYLFVSDGKFVLKPRKAESSVFSFTTANILQDSFSAEQVDRAQRSNRVQAYYHSVETYNAEADVVRDDEDDQRMRADQAGNDGVIEEVLHLLAVDRRSHAERLAEMILRENVGSRWMASWKTTIKGIALEPGDVVDVTHPARVNWSAKLMRIEELTHDEKDNLSLRLSEYVPSAYI